MFKLPVFVAALLIGAFADGENCTVSWCCGDSGDECHVTNATWSSDTSSCTCECESGYFSYKENHQCSFCGGHGISFNETALKCECENYWTDQYFCNKCPSPYGGDDCDRCEDGLTNFPSCNECEEDYFHDPSNSAGTVCIPNAACDADYCVGQHDLGGHVHNASVVNGVCVCNCEEGWYGDFNNETMSGYWGACYFCSGHGTAYDGNCTCKDKFASTKDPVYSCSTCTIPYNSTTCNECAEPWDDNMHYTAYPECSTYYTFPFDWSLFWEIVLPMAGIFVLGGVMFLCVIYYLRRKQRLNEVNNNDADGSVEIGDHSYTALKDKPDSTDS